MLYHLLSHALGYAPASPVPAAIDWRTVIDTAQAQGVAPLAFVGLQHYTAAGGTAPAEATGELFALALQAQQAYKRRWKATQHIADILAADGIQMVVLKGASIAQYYAHPEARVSVDVDFVPVGAGQPLYDCANDIIERSGIAVKRGSKRLSIHSNFQYGGVAFECHHRIASCSTIGGVNDALLTLLAEEGTGQVGGTNVYMPGPRFTQAQCVLHAYSHMLGNDISLRMLVDFAVLGCSRGIDLALPSPGLQRFMHCMAGLAAQRLGATVPRDFKHDERGEALLESYFYSPRNYTGGLPLAKRYAARLRSVRDNWARYKEFADVSPITATCRRIRNRLTNITD